ncbi:MAG: cell division topological specificity factor MinE [Clostridia bacterium]|nr:cell division topological specificity factor MinE [Clostridia bacterium]MBR7141236.1 cell division topological specificity factor MinE [Clostridia bacterium]
MAVKRVAKAQDRLKSVVMSEKITAIESMLRVLKSEQYKLLTNYMYLDVNDLKVYIDVTENGEYVLTVKAVTDKLIDIGRVLV